MDEPPVSSVISDFPEHHVPPHATRAAEGLPRRRFTISEVEAIVEAGLIPEDERLELIGGELVMMSLKGNRHEVVKAALLERWYRRTTDACTLIPETTFRLSEDTYLEPDIVIYDRASGLKGLTGESVLLVVEIADSSLRYDIGRKALLYASFGIRELWVIDAVRLTTRVFRKPTIDGFGETHDLGPSDVLVPHVAPDVFSLRLGDFDVA